MNGQGLPAARRKPDRKACSQCNGAMRALVTIWVCDACPHREVRKRDGPQHFVGRSKALP